MDIDSSCDGRAALDVHKSEIDLHTMIPAGPPPSHSSVELPLNSARGKRRRPGKDPMVPANSQPCEASGPANSGEAHATLFGNDATRSQGGGPVDGSATLDSEDRNAACSTVSVVSPMHFSSPKLVVPAKDCVMRTAESSENGVVPVRKTSRTPGTARKRGRKKQSPRKYTQKVVWDGVAPLEVNHRVYAEDKLGEWFEGVVSDCKDLQVRVHFKGWSTSLDEWIDRESPRITTLDLSTTDQLEHQPKPRPPRVTEVVVEVPVESIAAPIGSPLVIALDGGRGKRKRLKKEIWDPTDVGESENKPSQTGKKNSAAVSARKRYGCPPLSKGKACSFCLQKGNGQRGEGELLGPFGPSGKIHYVHHMCAIWAAGVVEEEAADGSISLTGIPAAVEKSKTYKCKSCGGGGATIECCGARLSDPHEGEEVAGSDQTSTAACSAHYHYGCMVAAGCAPISTSFECLCPLHAVAIDTAIGPLARKIRRQVACDSCFSVTGPDTLLFCTVCGVRYHRECVPGMETVDIEKCRPQWQCPSCKICHGCDGRGDDERMVVCDTCDVSYHVYCIKHPLAAIPKGAWKCDRCVQCRDCGATTSTKWCSDYSLCQVCHDRSLLPPRCAVCDRPPEEHGRHQFLTCCSCFQQVNIACAEATAITDRVTFDLRYSCPDCVEHRNESHFRRKRSKTASVGDVKREAINDSAILDDKELGESNPTLVYFSQDSTLAHDLCAICGSLGREEEGRLMFCVQCGEGFHPFCLKITNATVDVNTFMCMDCVTCEDCDGGGAEDKMLVCEVCHRGHHIFCLKPPLAEIPEGSWSCEHCPKREPIELPTSPVGIQEDIGEVQVVNPTSKVGPRRCLTCPYVLSAVEVSRRFRRCKPCRKAGRMAHKDQPQIAVQGSIKSQPPEKRRTSIKRQPSETCQSCDGPMRPSEIGRGLVRCRKCRDQERRANPFGSNPITCTCGRTFSSPQALGGHRGKCTVPRMSTKSAQAQKRRRSQSALSKSENALRAMSADSGLPSSEASSPQSNSARPDMDHITATESLSLNNASSDDERARFGQFEVEELKVAEPPEPVVLMDEESLGSASAMVIDDTIALGETLMDDPMSLDTEPLPFSSPTKHYGQMLETNSAYSFDAPPIWSSPQRGNVNADVDIADDCPFMMQDQRDDEQLFADQRENIQAVGDFESSTALIVPSTHDSASPLVPTPVEISVSETSDSAFGMELTGCELPRVSVPPVDTSAKRLAEGQTIEILELRNPPRSRRRAPRKQASLESSSDDDDSTFSAQDFSAFKTLAAKQGYKIWKVESTSKLKPKTADMDTNRYNTMNRAWMAIRDRRAKLADFDCESWRPISDGVPKRALPLRQKRRAPKDPAPTPTHVRRHEPGSLRTIPPNPEDQDYEHFASTLMPSPASDSRKCCLCGATGDGTPKEHGRLLIVDIDQWVHVNCALWSTDVIEYLDGSLAYVPEAICSGQKTKCHLCEDFGSTVQCRHPKCMKTYHMHCAASDNCHFFVNRHMYCSEHIETASGVPRVTDLRALRTLSVAQDGSVLLRAQEKKAIVRSGAIAVVTPGKIDYTNSSFHTRDRIYPSGFKTTRIYWSTLMPYTRVMYTSEIGSMAKRPIFLVSHSGTGESPPRVFQADTPDAAWRMVQSAVISLWDKHKSIASDVAPVIHAAARSAGASIMLDRNEAALFGLTPTIEEWIEELPNASNCVNYKNREKLRELRPHEAAEEFASHQGGCARAHPYEQTEYRNRRKHFRAAHGSELATQILELKDSRAVVTPMVRDAPARSGESIFFDPTALSQTAQYRRLAEESHRSTFVSKSMIQGMGLRATRPFHKGEMVIEYVGELVRKQISEHRERKYNRRGIGCYMFGISNHDLVIDATMKGGAARFINHSCEPNCMSKCVVVDKRPRIVIVAMRNIATNEEFCYDYQFDLDETDRVPCNCGARKCRGFMN